MIVKLNARGGQCARRSADRASPGRNDVPRGLDGRPSNIYERPRGPRTGIGYPKAGVIEVRFVIPSKIAGSVIGRGGDLVTQLRSKFDVEIGVPASDKSIDRVVIIRGQSVRNVIDCVCSIADYPLRKEMGRGLDLRTDCSQVRLLLHQSICGNVIGKGGQLIHEIRTEAGTDVHMYNEQCPRSTDRICRITGRISEIRDALAMVFKYTGENSCRGPETDYDARNSTGNEDGRDYGGWRLSEVRKMGAPEHKDEYASNQFAGKGAKKQNLPSNWDELSERGRSKFDRHGNIRVENLTEVIKERRRESGTLYYWSGAESRSPSPESRIKKELRSMGSSRRRKTSSRKSRSRSPRRRDGARDRRKMNRNKSDAPVYEGPNSSGPNRADRKKEHPLTALDLKRMQDKSKHRDKRDKMKELLD